MQPVDLWVWGVDVSTKRVAIACHGPDSYVETVEFPPQHHGARLADIWEGTTRLVLRTALERPPLYVWVEQPASYGRMPEPQLLYAVGVVQAAIYSTLKRRGRYPTEVRTIAVGQWKKEAVGFGNADKPQVLAWAKQDGYKSDHVCGSKKCVDPAHDQADAWAIARAGQAMIGHELAA